jgi:hypothetical protein
LKIEIWKHGANNREWASVAKEAKLVEDYTAKE